MDFEFIKFRLTIGGELEITYYDEDMAAWRPLHKLSAEDAHNLALWLAYYVGKDQGRKERR